MPNLEIVDRIALVAIIAAIAGIPLISNASPDARAKSGKAAATLTINGGAERRFYTSGPMGTTTYRVDVSSSGDVLSEEQVLSDDVFQRIQHGMPASDVLAMIGPPYAKSRFEATKTTAWDYHYRDTWGYDADFSVIVNDAGITVGKVRVRNGN